MVAHQRAWGEQSARKVAFRVVNKAKTWPTPVHVVRPRAAGEVARREIRTLAVSSTLAHGGHAARRVVLAMCVRRGVILDVSSGLALRARVHFRRFDRTCIVGATPLEAFGPTLPLVHLFISGTSTERAFWGDRTRGASSDYAPVHGVISGASRDVAHRACLRLGTSRRTLIRRVFTLAEERVLKFQGDAEKERTINLL